jgi:hypothetical protein
MDDLASKFILSLYRSSFVGIAANGIVYEK